MKSNRFNFRRSFILIFFLFLSALITGCSGDCSEYWVSTNGNDAGPGTQANPFLTIEHARDAVRSDPLRAKCPITVTIQGGTYRLNSPLTFGPQDSGASASAVTYQAAPGETPIISGGIQVSNWTLQDAGLNIWAASVNTTTMPRQLYVNGTRATRARTIDYPNYYGRTDEGYDYLYLVGSDPQIPPTWENANWVEAVTATQWKMMRCPIEEVSTLDNILYSVVMQTPCWNNANVFPEPWNFQLLNWWENAYEFLDEAGEWYLNPTTQVLYYIPRSGENMASADVELPVLETLIDASGTASQPVSYLYFQGLTFEYATWLAPNTSEGYALDQSGFHLVGNDHVANTIGHDPNDVALPGNLNFIYAQNIVFQNNTVQHMGAAGLSFGTGSQNNQILNNVFSDISGTGIQLGGIASEDSHPTTPSQFTQDNTISNNLVEYTGQEYWDTPGIYVGFTTRSLVEHNDVQHTSWSGIAIGWGWGLRDPLGFPGLPHATFFEWGPVDGPSAAHGNQILHNHIQYFLERLWDGGAIYSTGFQGTSLSDGQLIAYNVAENKRPAAGGNTFYTDGGSRYNTVLQNVSLNNPQGTMDFGPCDKASSFDVLCLLTGVEPYGEDMGGCIPYGDMVFQENYLRDPLDFYDICSNALVPTAPYNMSFINNVKVTNSSQVPAWILDSAGRQ